MRRLRIRRRFLGIVFAVLTLTLGLGAIIQVARNSQAKAADAPVVLYVNGAIYRDGSAYSGSGYYWTNHFSMMSNGNNLGIGRSWCGDAFGSRSNTPASGSYNGASLQTISITGESDKYANLYKAMYYGTNGYYNSRGEFITHGDASLHMVIHVLLHEADGEVVYNQMTDYERQLYDYVKNKNNKLPEGTKNVYILNTGQYTQRILTFDYAAPTKRSLTIKKVWRDENNKTQKRPGSITVDVLDSARNIVRTVTLNADGNWTARVDDLSPNEKYTISEWAVEGYSASDPVCNQDNSECTIENTIEGEFGIRLKKTWNDFGYESNRPSAVYFNIYGSVNGREYYNNTFALYDSIHTSPNDAYVWSGFVDGLDKYDDEGRTINYCVREEIIYDNDKPNEKYGYTISGNDANNCKDSSAGNIIEYNFTNTLETITLPVLKNWDDHGFEENRPKGVEIKIFQNGIYYGLVNLSSIDEVEHGYAWATNVTLPKTDKNGTEFTYSFEEISPNESYKVTESANGNDGVTLTNEYLTTNVRVQKIWNDNDNAARLRPRSVSFVLLKPTYQYMKIPGTDQYTISSTEYNSYKTIRVTSTSTCSDGTTWCVEIKDLPKSDYRGTSFEYVLSERRASDMPYSSSIANLGYDEQNNVFRFTATNTITRTTNVEVVKHWKDNYNISESRPNHVDFILIKKKNNVEVSRESITLTTEDADGDVWRKEISDLSLYDTDGIEFKYEIVEDPLWLAGDGAKYRVDLATCDIVDADYSCDFTNTIHDVTSYTNIKDWRDGGKTQYRPGSINIVLKRYIKGDTSTAEIVNVAPTWDKSTAENSWYYTYSNLPKYDSNGNLYTYYAEEADATISAQNSSDTYVNTNSNGGYIVNTLTGTTNLAISKVWVDGGSSDMVAQRSAVRFRIFRKSFIEHAGEMTEHYRTVRVSSLNNWSVNLSNIEKYNESGYEYTYFVVEETELSKYESVQTVGEFNASRNLWEFVFENTYKDETEIEVKKCWLDDNHRVDRDSIDFRIVRTKNGVDDTSFSRTLSLTSDDEQGDGCWHKKVTGLEHRVGNDLYEYRVTEEASDAVLEKYRPASTAPCVVSALRQECEFDNIRFGTVRYPGYKRWLDGLSSYKRPTDVEIVVMRRLEGHSDTDEVVTDEALAAEGAGFRWTNKVGNEWSYEYTGLQAFNEEGIRYSYYFVEKYNTVPATDNSGDSYVNVSSDNGYFVNRLTGNTQYCGKKVWRDGDVPNSIKPSYITVHLTRKNDDSFDRAATVNDASSAEAATICESLFDDGAEVGEDGVTRIWYFNFKDLEKYDSDGYEWEYSFNEDAIETYITTYSAEHNIAYNDYADKPTKIRLVKKWVNDKEEDRRPVFFTIIRIDGDVREDYKTVELNKENNWTYEEEFDGNYGWDVREETELSGYTKGQAKKTILDDGTIVIEIPNTIDHPLVMYFLAIPGLLAVGFVVGKVFLIKR